VLYRITWSWYTGRWWVGSGLLHLVQRGGDCAGPQPAQAHPRCIPNVTAHLLTASTPVVILLYNSSLFCGFNVPVKGLKSVLLAVLTATDLKSAHTSCKLRLIALQCYTEIHGPEGYVKCSCTAQYWPRNETLQCHTTWNLTQIILFLHTTMM